MSEQPPADAGTTEAAPSLETVEAVVRRQLATALGGRRGMIEAAVPTLLFTITWLTQRNLTLALTISVAAALVLLAVRLVQRSTPQFVLNALFGIGIGWVFVRISASRVETRTPRHWRTSCPASSTPVCTAWSSPSPA